MDVTANSFHAEIELADGLARLVNTTLKQAGSSYDIDGEYQVGDIADVMHSMQRQSRDSAPESPAEAEAEQGDESEGNAEGESEQQQGALQRHAAAIGTMPLPHAAATGTADGTGGAQAALPAIAREQFQLAPKRRWWALGRGRRRSRLPQLPTRQAQPEQHAAPADADQSDDAAKLQVHSAQAAVAGEASDGTAVQQSSTEDTQQAVALPNVLRRPSRMSADAAERAQLDAAQTHDAQSAEAGAAAEQLQLQTEAVQEPTTGSWWLRLRATAQLADIVPAVQLSQQQQAKQAKRAPPVAASASAQTDAPSTSAQQSIAGQAKPRRRGSADDAELGSTLEAPLDFGSQELAMGYDASSGRSADGFSEFERRVQECAWFAGEPATNAGAAAPSSAVAAHKQRLPALATLTGSLQGEVTASGGPDGAARVELDMSGAAWDWGPIHVQDLALVGHIDGDTGLQLEKCQVKVRSVCSGMLAVHKARKTRMLRAHEPVAAAPGATYSTCRHAEQFRQSQTMPLCKVLHFAG